MAVAGIERKTKRYPSDLIDEQRDRIAPRMPATVRRGHLREVDFREGINAVRYLARSGCGYAERLGLRPRGSNRCKGTPRYKRKPMERFLSPQEYARLATALRDHEAEQPLYVAAIRLLIFTGACCREIEQLRWEWVQEPRLMLPDSKTGAKIVCFNRQVVDVIARRHRPA